MSSVTTEILFSQYEKKTPGWSPVTKLLILAKNNERQGFSSARKGESCRYLIHRLEIHSCHRIGLHPCKRWNGENWNPTQNTLALWLYSFLVVAFSNIILKRVAEAPIEIDCIDHHQTSYAHLRKLCMHRIWEIQTALRKFRYTRSFNGEIYCRKMFECFFKSKTANYANIQREINQKAASIISSSWSLSAASFFLTGN